jgi:hypothetical protein
MEFRVMRRKSGMTINRHGRRRFFSGLLRQVQIAQALRILP